MSKETDALGKDWGNLATYLDGVQLGEIETEPEAPPKIVTERVFHFTEELIDQNGEPIEPEVAEDTFIGWLEGLKPQGIDVPYSTQKVPYLLAVYAAVPEWLGCSEAFMEVEYGYKPAALSKAFSEQRAPDSKVITQMLDSLIEQAKSVVSSHDSRPEQDGGANWWEKPPEY